MKDSQRYRERCRQCGGPMPKSHWGRKRAYCSAKCKCAYNNAKRPKVRGSTQCQNCGGPLPVRQRRFCSERCQRWGEVSGDLSAVEIERRFQQAKAEIRQRRLAAQA